MRPVRPSKPQETRIVKATDAVDETLGERIKRLRVQKRLSLRELAKQVKVSAPFLSDVERNRRSTTRLQEIATALGVDVATLEDADQRLTNELRDWLSQSPGMIRVIKELRTSGLSSGEIQDSIRALRGHPRRSAQ